MPPAGLPRTHRACIVSDAVPRRIARAGDQPMRVQSVYRSVVNIATADGILTIASPDTGGLPNGILADPGPDWRAIGLRPGMAVRADESAVRVPDAGLEIGIAASPRWSPRFRASAGMGDVPTARWRKRASVTRSVALRRAVSGGFGALVDDRLGGDETTLRIARPVLAGLVDSLELGDRRRAAATAAGLFGLGPGLTPSGDDVLVGIEAALHALAHPAAGFLSLAVDDIETRTTELAATLLRHAAAGEFAERLHALLAALLGPDDWTIPGAIERAVAWGATSGTDCLVGVLIGLDVAAGVRGAVA